MPSVAFKLNSRNPCRCQATLLKEIYQQLRHYWSFVGDYLEDRYLLFYEVVKDAAHFQSYFLFREANLRSLCQKYVIMLCFNSVIFSVCFVERVHSFNLRNVSIKKNISLEYLFFENFQKLWMEKKVKIEKNKIQRLFVFLPINIREWQAARAQGFILIRWR